MSLPMTSIKYLLGDGLRVDFGELTDYCWTNKRGTHKSQDGKYIMWCFDCLWGIKRRYDKKFLIESATLESYENSIKYIGNEQPLYLYTIRRRNKLFWDFILSDGYKLIVKAEEEEGELCPFYFTNHDGKEVSFEEFYREVFLKDDEVEFDPTCGLNPNNG